jgi:hypothetical protein
MAQLTFDDLRFLKSLKIQKPGRQKSAARLDVIVAICG